MFCDQVSATLIAGKGGDGFMGFRREKFVPRGGPDGGDGGRGGHVLLKVNPNINSLIDIRKRKIYQAEAGENGHRSNRAGRAGEDLILEVPPGTLVYNEETDDLIVDLVKPGEAYQLLEGGRGGYGNAHFATSIRQAPDFAERGEPGASMNVHLEMRMVADVGIIGLPSVGKSTLIAHITDAKPKIADYPFTTLVPNMGVVDMKRFGGSKGETFVIADIPGLIEGAHEGKGLGDEFLRHISRTAILLHVLDCQSQDIFHDYEVIVGELKAYDPALAKRQHALAINKIDTLDKETTTFLIHEIEKYFKRKKRKAPPIFAISAHAGEGLKPLVFHLFKEVQGNRKLLKQKSTESPQETYRVFRPHLEDKQSRAFEVLLERTKKIKEGEIERRFRIKGKRIEQIVAMTDIENKSAVARIYDVMMKQGIVKELKKSGAKNGDEICIGEQAFEFRE